MRGEGLGVRVWGQGQGQGEGQEQRERESRAAGPRGEPHARVRPRPQCPARAWVGTVGPEPSARAWSPHTETRGVRGPPWPHTLAGQWPRGCTRGPHCAAISNVHGTCSSSPGPDTRFPVPGVSALHICRRASACPVPYHKISPS